MEPREVRITLTVIGATNRDPWEWAEVIALFLQGELNEQRGDIPGEITVTADNVEPA